MPIPREESLTSLALLLAFAREKKSDYLDYLTPFILDAIRHCGTQGVNRIRLRDEIASRFGLTIPSFTVELCLKRLRASGHLRFSGVYGGVYTPGHNFSNQECSLAEKRTASSENIKHILVSLAAFASSEFNVSLDPEAAVTSVLAYLSNYGIDCINAYFEKSPIPLLQADKRNIVIVNAFIRHAQESDSSLFGNVIGLVQAYMLANALLCPDIGKDHAKLSELTLFLDTPLLLRILDLDDKDACEAAQEFIALCKSLHCKLAVFSHTQQETYGVMMACASKIFDPTQKGRLIREMRLRGTSGEDLTLLARDLGLSLANLGIAIVKSPPYDPEYLIGESILDSALKDEIKYLNPQAKLYDINSIRSIYALRSGRHPKWIEEAQAVLVTTNSALARSAFSFGRKYESSREVSTVISSFSLANILWLKSGSITTSIPRLEAMALAYSALQPSDALWEKVLKIERELRSRSSAALFQDHSWIRFSPKANRELMWMTLGDTDSITKKTVDDLIKVAEAELVKDERKARLKESQEYSESLSLQRVKLQEMASGNESLQRILVETQRRRELISLRAEEIAANLARWAQRIVFCACVIAYIVGLIGLEKLFSSSWILLSGAAVALIAGITSTLLGSGPLQWSKSLESAVQKRLMLWMTPSELNSGSILGITNLQPPADT